MSKKYDLAPIKTPTLDSWKLSLYARVVRLPVVGDALVQQIKSVNRIQEMVDLSQTPPVSDHLPLYYPIHAMGREEEERHEQMAKSIPLSIRRLIAAQGVKQQYQQHRQEQELEKEEEYFKHWTIHDYVSRYLKKTVTPTQVVEHLIKIIEKVNETNPIVIHMNPEDLRKQAAESTERYAKLNMKGDLDGVPILVKDCIPTVGFPSTHGTSFEFSERCIDQDLIPVENLKHQGVIIVGKTNQHEMGVGTTGSNVTYGTPRNPYNHDHHTGGSTSGSAAAVAMGLVPIALGTDGGGSVRIPSGLCGCIGIKPTFDRLSIDAKSSPSLVHLGVMAGSVNDAAVAYAIMAGHGQKKESASASASASVPEPETQLEPEPESETETQPETKTEPQSELLNGENHRHRPTVHLHDFMNKSSGYLKGLRIGVFWDHIEDAEENVVRATKRAIEFFRSEGALIIGIDLPFLRQVHAAHGVTILTEMSLFMEKHWEQHSDDLAGETICVLSYGRSFTGREFLASQRMRAFAMRHIEHLFQDKIDIILSPSTPSVAPRIQEDALSHGELDAGKTTSLMRYVIHGNLTGIPGAVFPIDYDAETGLPISLQIQAAHWREDLLFRVAKEAECILPKGWDKPASYVDVLGTSLAS